MVLVLVLSTLVPGTLVPYSTSTDQSSVSGAEWSGEAESGMGVGMGVGMTVGMGAGWVGWVRRALALHVVIAQPQGTQ